MILMTAAGSQDGAAGMAVEDCPDHVEALFRPAQVIQPELEERLAGCGLAVCVLKKLNWIGYA
jgi:hypothetical protein